MRLLAVCSKAVTLDMIAVVVDSGTTSSSMRDVSGSTADTVAVGICPRLTASKLA